MRDLPKHREATFLRHAAYPLQKAGRSLRRGGRGGVMREPWKSKTILLASREGCDRTETARAWEDLVTGRAGTTPPQPPLRKGGKKAQRDRDESAACARLTFHQPSVSQIPPRPIYHIFRIGRRHPWWGTRQQAQEPPQSSSSGSRPGGAVLPSLGDPGAMAAGEPSRRWLSSRPWGLNCSSLPRRRLAGTDRNGPRLGCPALGHPDGQDAVLGARLGGIKVDITRDHDLPEERAEPPLPERELSFGQLADFLHASEDQQVAADGELDLRRIHARDLRHNDRVFRGLVNVDKRAPSGGLQVGGRALSTAAALGLKVVLEHPRQLVLKKIERDERFATPLV